MVVAFAGRRIDASNATEVRFPEANVAVVRDRIRAAFTGYDVTTLVASAACGADLIALELAGELGLRRIVVLPWDAERFRAGSVVDRGAEWGALYDRTLREIASRDVRVLDRHETDDRAYIATNDGILDTALDAARHSDAHEDVMAMVAWNGETRARLDVTGAFIEAARRRGLMVAEIATV